MTAIATIDFTYCYLSASELSQSDRGLDLCLATCGALQEHPHYFDGRLREPRIVGDMLLVLSHIVRTHFFLARPHLLDPVVTSSEAMMRFEAFSGCCGVYARVDLPVEAFDTEIRRHGTTNVDFNDPMRAALSRIQENDAVWLKVGAEEVSLKRGAESVVEKKVKLPVRWIKGFSEVQAYQPRLCLKLEVPAAEARRFLRNLPAGQGPKHTCYVSAVGRALRLTTLPSAASIPITGTNRIRVLEPLMRSARSLRIWSDDTAGTSAWEVLFSTGRFFLMVSPDLYRGFSGEGQILQKLATGPWKAALQAVHSRLSWQDLINSHHIARQTGLSLEEVEAALGVLSTRGMVGFDVNSGQYFHRVLPFDLGQIETLQPRLQGARNLLKEKRVELLEQHPDGCADMAVGGTNVTHHVRLRPDGDRCTCHWFNKHQGQRGPCKHILAARMLIDDDQATPDEDTP
jgi:hypothetical protein